MNSIPAREYNKRAFENFPQRYSFYKSVLLRHLKPGSKILDVGSGPATLGHLLLDSELSDISIFCVDKNSDYISEAITYSDRIMVNVGVVEDIFNVAKILSFYNFDFITCNMALHEISNPKNQSDDLERLLQILKPRIKPCGKLIIGDSFYPAELSDEEVNAYIELQRQKFGHADSRDTLIHPKLVEDILQHHFSIIEKQETYPIKEINQLYYIFIGTPAPIPRPQ